MDKEDFLKRVALTLELSITMAEIWLDQLHPDSEEERVRMNEHKDVLAKLLVEMGEYTQSIRDKYKEER